MKKRCVWDSDHDNPFNIDSDLMWLIVEKLEKELNDLGYGSSGVPSPVDFHITF
jgi:hypothetical protein